MNIDYSINVGHLITIAAILFAGAGFYWRQLYDGRTFKSDIKEIKLDLKTLNEAMSNQKLIEHRLIQLEKWWDELRRGKGFIVDDGRKPPRSKASSS
jgi:hypothetical protein